MIPTQSTNSPTEHIKYGEAIREGTVNRTKAYGHVGCIEWGTAELYRDQLEDHAHRTGLFKKGDQADYVILYIFCLLSETPPFH